jgi:hypothetical protein
MADFPVYSKTVWTTGDVITQTKARGWEDGVEDLSQALVAMATTHPRCNAYHSSTQTVLASATDALSLDSEIYDIGSMHSTSTNTNRVTIPEVGVYLAIGHTTVSAANNANVILHVRVGGAGQMSSRTNATGSSLLATTLNVFAILSLGAGDYVDLAGEAEKEAALFGSATAMQATRLIVCRIL